MKHSYRLVIHCPDRVGIVATVSQFIADNGGSLLEASYHADPATQRFFMRTEIEVSSLSIDLPEFESRFKPVADTFNMTWQIRDSLQKRKVAMLASQSTHCLADLLHRWQSGDLFCDVPCVISNHETVRDMVECYGMPFYHVPMQGDAAAKHASFEKIAEIIDHHSADTIVLARFMQILPADFCSRYARQIINIHHSFLPSFIGANPYKKAYERGVKLIGATCHYVTDDLDEGPIIEQDVVRVGHKQDHDDLVRLGKDVEARVLAQGLRYHLEDRAMVQGNKTVIFD